MKMISIALIAAGCLTACQRSPIGPGSSAPVISGVQIGGPREVPPGQTVRFTLIATLSDRTTRDVTSEATWTSGDGQVVSIGSPGDVTGRQTGTSMIEAGFDGHRARKEVYVLPAGTYVLTGRLRERGNRDLSVAGARIEVTSGAGAGLVTTTNAEGVFSLYGVSGETTLHVTKDGFARLTQTFSVMDHLGSITLELLFLGGHPDLSGTYTLTITAASDCGVGVGQGNLPEEVRVRSYAAAVEQDDGFLWVTLSGPGFRTELESYFYGAVQPERAVFSLRNPDDGTPPVPVPVASTRVEIVHDPDTWNVHARKDGDDSYLLDWDAGWYCVWLDNIPNTRADDCRDYTFTFSWLPVGSAGSGSWSGATWSRGCHTYPNLTNPGACFVSPSRNSVSELQSIIIVGRERTRIRNGAETEVFRTEEAIRFQDR